MGLDIFRPHQRLLTHSISATLGCFLLPKQSKFFLVPAPLQRNCSLCLEFFSQTLCRAAFLVLPGSMAAEGFPDHPIEKYHNLPSFGLVYILHSLRWRFPYLFTFSACDLSSPRLNCSAFYPSSPIPDAQYNPWLGAGARPAFVD